MSSLAGSQPIQPKAWIRLASLGEPFLIPPQSRTFYSRIDENGLKWQTISNRPTVNPLQSWAGRGKSGHQHIHSQIKTNHIAKEIIRGLTSMKFAVNHRERFESYKLAWLAGFMQISSAMIIEMANLLVILASYTALDVVMDFMALELVS